MASVFQGLYIFLRQDAHQSLYDGEWCSPSFSSDLHILYDLHLLVGIHIRLTQDAELHLFFSNRYHSKVFFYNFKTSKFFLKELPISVQNKLDCLN